jgi:hypothetical protein
MKVQITPKAKEILSVSEMPAARQIVKDFQEDEDLDRYISSVARIVCGYNESFEVLRSSAEIAKNCRIRDYYGDNTADLDVWVYGLAFNWFYGLIEIGAYISDVFSITGTAEDKDILNHIYFREYRPAE